ncbi:MAG: RelA/SpoT domain-containing protein [Candidatus Limnocylindrales bacterium]|nr:RelA/SpoT domain-containing protein [Candidatus Limnocylindrales bacterium]
MIDLVALARDYERERPRYDRLAEVLEPAIKECLLDAGLTHVIICRVKDYASLARKAVKKGWPDAIRRTPDLLGVRVITSFSAMKDPVVAALRDRFVISDDDDKGTKYGSTEFRYLGRHMQIAFRGGDEPAPELASYQAELQLHTRAESAWADASHDLTYKAALELPDALDRRVNRLLALVELFDGEMGRAQAELIALPGFPAARMLQTLERSFLPLAQRDFDRELATIVLTAVAPSYTNAELAAYDALIARFVADGSERLRVLYQRWSADPFSHPLLFQPEALAIFERLDHNPTALRDHWDRVLPPPFLDQLAELWGAVLSRPGDAD